jgi:(1->4)-alpha-D-glucan 1-alpha-D-glucosylmutase
LTHPGLFSTGDYLSVEAAGPHRDHVCAFLRHLGKHMALVAVPRLLTRLTGGVGKLPLGPEVWGESVLLLPGELGPQRRWRNVFTEEALALEKRQGQPVLPLARVFRHFPVALFLAQE